MEYLRWPCVQLPEGGMIVSRPDIIIQELDRLYEFDTKKYVEECEDLKKIGYRIFRNQDGKHQIIEPSRPSDAYGDNDIYNAFGGIFRDIFKGGA